MASGTRETQLVIMKLGKIKYKISRLKFNRQYNIYITKQHDYYISENDVRLVYSENTYEPTQRIGKINIKTELNTILPKEILETFIIALIGDQAPTNDYIQFISSNMSRILISFIYYLQSAIYIALKTSFKLFTIIIFTFLLIHNTKQ